MKQVIGNGVKTLNGSEAISNNLSKDLQMPRKCEASTFK